MISHAELVSASHKQGFIQQDDNLSREILKQVQDDPSILKLQKILFIQSLHTKFNQILWFNKAYCSVNWLTLSVKNNECRVCP